MALWLADAILLLHVLVVAFVVFSLPLIWLGAWRGWKWVRVRGFRLAHLATIAFIVVQTWLGELCPLTIWENDLRAQAGQQGYGESFIAHWLSRLIFVDASLWLLGFVYSAFAALVVLTWWWVRPGGGAGARESREGTRARGRQ